MMPEPSTHRKRKETERSQLLRFFGNEFNLLVSNSFFNRFTSLERHMMPGGESAQVLSCELPKKCIHLQQLEVRLLIQLHSAVRK